MSQATVEHTSQFWIRQVQSKLASGLYRTEEVSCFCGSEDRTVLVQQDRYGMEYCLALCMNCGLLYASPRMTAETFQQFYDCEYRQIYLDTDDEHATSIENGFAVLDLCKHHELMPRSVIDVGCNRGAMLQAFEEHGCEVMGVDLDHVAIARGIADGRPIQVGSLESLLADGRTADLVILHHVLEHALDLREMLAGAPALVNITLFFFSNFCQFHSYLVFEASFLYFHDFT